MSDDTRSINTVFSNSDMMEKNQISLMSFLKLVLVFRISGKLKHAIHYLNPDPLKIFSPAYVYGSRESGTYLSIRIYQVSKPLRSRRQHASVWLLEGESPPERNLCPPCRAAPRQPGPPKTKTSTSTSSVSSVQLSRDLLLWRTRTRPGRSESSALRFRVFSNCSKSRFTTGEVTDH